MQKTVKQTCKEQAVPVMPITELIQGKRYLIKYSEQFCYSLGMIDKESLKQKQVEVIFVGKIVLSSNTERNIFYDENKNGTYFMFSTKLNYIVKQLD